MTSRNPLFENYIRLLEETSALYKRVSAHWENVAKLAEEASGHAVDCMISLQKVKADKDEFRHREIANENN